MQASRSIMVSVGVVDAEDGRGLSERIDRLAIPERLRSLFAFEGVPVSVGPDILTFPRPADPQAASLLPARNQPLSIDTAAPSTAPSNLKWTQNIPDD